MNVDASPASKPERRAIVMLAIGNRPWSALTAELFSRYAARCGADFILETALPPTAEFPLPDLPDDPGRPNKAAYACKTYLAWRALAVRGYDRILVVDDSCCVKLDAPNVFDEVPPGCISAIRTSGTHAAISFAAIRAVFPTFEREGHALDPDRYLNSGVMLYDRAFADAIAPNRIVAATGLLFNDYPHQTLSYYLLEQAKVPIRILSEKFNSLPNPELPYRTRRHIKSALPEIDRDIHIFHLTGGYMHRDIIIPELAWHLLHRHDPDAADAIDYRAVPRTLPPWIVRKGAGLRRRLRSLF